MLEKLYELWSIEKRVSVTIKSVGLNCTFTTVIENIYKGEDSVVLEFGDNNMKLELEELIDGNSINKIIDDSKIGRAHV